MARAPAWKSLEVPVANSRWDYVDRDRTVRVMGSAEGYVVARLSGSAPFLMHMSDWYLNFKPKASATPKQPD